MSYVERLAAMPVHRTEYVSQADFKRQNTALTRAINSGDPSKVLVAVEKTLGEWNGKAWPDDWTRWSRALEDAAWAARRSDDYNLGEEISAAVLVLFR